MTREQWFIDRIGKRVFRNNTFCCDACTEVYHQGLIVADKDHASYIQACEAEFSAAGDELRYFDTKEEVLEFESKLPKDV